MSFLPDENLYVTYEELYMLLAAVGREKIYSIDQFSDTVIPETEEEIYPVIVRLYQKGLLDWEEGKAAVSGKYRHVLEVLRDAKWCMVSASNSSSIGFSVSYFCDSRIMTVRRSQNDKRTLIISFETMADMTERLEDEDIMPDPLQVSAIQPLARYMVLDEGKDLKDLLEDEQISFAAELRSANEGILKERLIVRDEGLYAVIYRQDKAKCRYYLSEKEIRDRILGSWMTGGEK